MSVGNGALYLSRLSLLQGGEYNEGDAARHVRRAVAKK